MATVFFTVWYGDYTGGTMAEILISISYEFTGIMMMSIIMYMITLLFNNNHKFSVYIDNKTTALELWINNIEKCN